MDVNCYAMTPYKDIIYNVYMEIFKLNIDLKS